MDNKYEDIINKDPAESFKKSIKTKQAWMKYGNNFKQGMKRRNTIDNLTGNDEDKFGYKEKTKKEYSSSRVGNVLNTIISSNFYKDCKVNITEDHDIFVGRVYKNKEYIGSFEFYYREDLDPEYIFIENMNKRSEFPTGFAKFVIDYLKNTHSDIAKGIYLIPLNEKLEKLYISLGFSPDISIGEDKYYKLEW